MNFLKEFIRKRPLLNDIMKQIKRLVGIKTRYYVVLKDFDNAIDRNVKFIQIGASDGLRRDPVREFVVWHGWNGIFVEPEPYSFSELKKITSANKKRTV